MFPQLILAAFLAGIVYTVPVGNNVDVKALASANNYFGVRMLRVLGSEEGNVFYSPISLSTLLSTLYIGARGKSQQELGQLGYHDLESGNVNVPASYQKLFKVLQRSTDEYNLEIANALLFQADYSILEEYKNTLVGNYDSLLKEVDFAKEKEKAIEEINAWVSRKTHGKISNLVDDLDDDTLMVLLNSVYFKGTWKTEFDSEMTKDRPFYNNGGSNSKLVPTMKLKSRFPYVYDFDKKLQAIQLPYKGEDISMLILLPFERDGIKRLLEELSYSTIDDIIRSLDETKVIMSLPKFKLEYSRKLKDYFRTMGISTVFGLDADLSGITGNKDLYVSEIVHKAVIEVNEQGSEASAISGGFISNKIRPFPDIINEFNVDHPFLFYIIDNRTKAHLFVGRVNEL